MLEGIIKSKSKTFLTFCFCFLTGIVIGSIYNKRIDFVYLYLSLFVFTTLFIIAYKNKTSMFIVVCSLIVAAGFFRYSFALAPAEFELPKGKQVFTAYVATEPDVRQDSVRYIVQLLTHNSELQTQLTNKKIYFKAGLYPRYQYGDVLEVECPLIKPKAFDGFRYDMYLAKFGVFAICQSPKITKVGGGQGNFALTKILDLKNIVSKRVNILWHEPYSSFVGGLLYGYRGGLGELNNKFNRTGVTHIIAISGYNISLIASFLLIAAMYARIRRQKAFWIITSLIIVFVLFAGASASVVRAGVMGMLVLLAKQMGRVGRVANAMAFTAVLMTLHNPLVLVWDAGFQLSFLATLGLVYLSPVIEVKFTKLPNYLGLRETLVATLSAITATLPLILYQFGRLSIVAPFVNVLILWIIPWVMLGGFLSLLLSFFIFPLGQLVAWVTWFAMSYVTVVVEWFANLSFSSVDLTIPLWLVIGAYIFYILLYKGYFKHR
jgi:competence protein ComEC